MANFDEKSKEYDEWFETPIGRFVEAREVECALSLIPINLGKNILDVGCGTGRFSIRMSLLGYQVTGIDLSEKMLAIAENKAKIARSDIKFLNMDIYQLKFPDNYFDGVVSMALFEFIQDPVKALEECFRVVKPGGYVMIGTITADSSWGKEYISHMNREDSVFRNASFKTREEMKSFFTDHLIKAKECVFISHNELESGLTLENELYKSKFEPGSFICTLWQKEV